jgi:DNA-binding transcriptional LysR family regulator
VAAKMKTNSDELELFVAVVDAGSLRQAAENLGVDNAVVSRRLKRLEEKLATTLLNRTTRRLSLTEEGQWFYQEAVTVLNQMAQAEAALIARKAEPEGVLRIDAATPFILHQLIPLISEFRHRYPRIELHLESSDGFINLLERRVDVAIRIGELTDSGLRAMPLGSSRLRLLAAPDYLARCGIPAAITDLQHHTLLGFTGSENLNCVRMQRLMLMPYCSKVRIQNLFPTGRIPVSLLSVVMAMSLCSMHIVCLPDNGVK